MTKQQRIEQYRDKWQKKTYRQVEKELDSYHRYLSKHSDGHFQEAAPDEMSDGDRVMVLKEVLRVKAA